MILKFANKYIYFCLESIWYNLALDYKFKTHIYTIVTANSDDDFVQDVEISAPTLLQIFKSVSSLPEGVSAVNNKEMLGILIPQLEAQSNNDNDNPNEAYTTLLGINQIGEENYNGKVFFIQKGKNKILEI